MCKLFVDHLGMKVYIEWLIEEIPLDEMCHIGEALIGELSELK